MTCTDKNKMNKLETYIIVCIIFILFYRNFYLRIYLYENNVIMESKNLYCTKTI